MRAADLEEPVPHLVPSVAQAQHYCTPTPMHFYTLAHYARIVVAFVIIILACTTILPAPLRRPRPHCLEGGADWVGLLAALVLGCAIPLVSACGNECSGGVE